MSGKPARRSFSEIVREWKSLSLAVDIYTIALDVPAQHAETVVAKLKSFEIETARGNCVLELVFRPMRTPERRDPPTPYKVPQNVKDLADVREIARRAIQEREETLTADRSTPAARIQYPAPAPPGTRAPIADDVAQSASDATSIAGEPAAGAPAPGEPTAGAPTAGAPAPGEPAAGAPTAGAPAPGEPAAGAPTAGAPAPGEPTAGAPTAGAPAPGEPTAGAPTAGARASDDVAQSASDAQPPSPTGRVGDNPTRGPVHGKEDNERPSEQRVDADARRVTALDQNLIDSGGVEAPRPNAAERSDERAATVAYARGDLGDGSSWPRVPEHEWTDAGYGRSTGMDMRNVPSWSQAEERSHGTAGLPKPNGALGPEPSAQHWGGGGNDLQTRAREAGQGREQVVTDDNVRADFDRAAQEGLQSTPTRGGIEID
ncbi:hypothetical protein CLV92_11915 [Kineococcus xinjiangensis]|uniref:Uncharacterized protein n=1 Tax=Kineococcus xinjiangensis TaxID=512762 RepID=A0A2S6ICI1_9ACTN|nr:hypothetical protein CLV92_11915 [Kineococcus xinjiangensis]